MKMFFFRCKLNPWGTTIPLVPLVLWNIHKQKCYKQLYFWLNLLSHIWLFEPMWVMFSKVVLAKVSSNHAIRLPNDKMVMKTILSSAAPLREQWDMCNLDQENKYTPVLPHSLIFGLVLWQLQTWRPIIIYN